jgi:hypothetical protein
MRSIRYETEAELLATQHLADGRVAVAHDTGTVWQYLTGVGWIRLERPADNELVPEGGGEDQVLAGDRTWQESGFVLGMAISMGDW